MPTHEVVRTASLAGALPLPDAEVLRPYVWPTPTPPPEERWLRAIFRLLHLDKGVDFSLYRRSGILRAVASRMNLLDLRTPEAYVQLLRRNAAELDGLFERILIKTTAFFRDPQAFVVLKRCVLQPMLARRSFESPLRVWVAGCSTGEEAYSIAMCLVECEDRLPELVPFQILATDVSDVALRKARCGEYSARMLEGVSRDRIERFFTKTAGGYRVVPWIRRSCIFSRHNLVGSIPFFQMDLVTCRNVLIYMEPELQRRALAKIHYSLRPGGALMLGSSEAVLRSSDWKPLKTQPQIYRRV